MKTALILPALLLLRIAATAQDFTLTGTIKGMPSGIVYMSYPRSEDKYTRDSAVVKEGRFIFKGTVPGPVSGNIYLDRQLIMNATADIADVFLQPGNMSITMEKGKLRDAKLQGSAVQDEMTQLKKERAPIQEKLRPFSIAFDEGNNRYIDAMRAKKDDAVLKAMSDSLNGIKEKMEPYYEQMNKIDEAFIEKHPSSYVTAMLMRYKVSGMPLAKGEAIYAKMSPAIRQSMYGKAIRKELDGLRMGSPGSVAHVFTKKDINGEELSLAAMKGKYILLDFWASWCGPCRKGNPHLKSLYSKYKERGLEIVGVSDDDRNEAAWKKAVKEDGIGIWKHVLRGLDMEKRQKGEPNPDDLSDYYGIHSLPTKILIDPQGMIIGRYGGGGEDDEAMDKKLAAVFGF